MKTNKTIGVYHLRRSLDHLEKELNSRISNLRAIIAELEAKEAMKGQTSLTDLNIDNTYESLENFLIVDRGFKKYGDFDKWAKKVRPPVVCECCFTATGEQYTYTQIRDIAKKCLTLPEVTVLGSYPDMKSSGVG